MLSNTCKKRYMLKFCITLQYIKPSHFAVHKTVQVHCCTYRMKIDFLCGSSLIWRKSNVHGKHGGVSEMYCFLECEVVWCVLALTLGGFATSIFKVEERILRRQHLDI
jgi:hypothetical protein